VTDAAVAGAPSLRANVTNTLTGLPARGGDGRTP
jgi:hypothetical protein